MYAIISLLSIVYKQALPRALVITIRVNRGVVAILYNKVAIPHAMDHCLVLFALVRLLFSHAGARNSSINTNRSVEVVQNF